MEQLIEYKEMREAIQRVRLIAEHYIDSEDEALRLIGIAILEAIIGTQGKYGEQ